MCIMFLKEHYQAFPSREVMKICWDDNRDGAGYSWYNRETGTWPSVKGIMNFNDFMDRFEEDRKKYKLDDETVIVHFRVGTTGGVDGAATHPFSLDPTIDIRETEFDSVGVIFHNGTCGPGTAQMSDTMAATIKYARPLVPYIFEDDEDTNRDLLDILEELLGNDSRWIITYGNKIEMFGKWVEDKESGLLYSNKRYIEANTRYYKRKNQWTGHAANWIDNLTSHVQGAINITLPGTVNKLSLFLKGVAKDVKTWDWQAWDNRYNLKFTKPTEEHKPETNGNVVKGIKVYDENNKEIYDIVDKVEDNTTILCPVCELIMRVDDLNDSECPGCRTLIKLDKYTTAEDYRDWSDSKCPTCNDGLTCPYDGQEVKSAHKLYDGAICLDCGCVYAHTELGTRWILGYKDKTGKFIPSNSHGSIAK